MIQVSHPKQTNKKFPLVVAPIPAGEAVEADGVIDWLDLNEYVARGSDSIIYIRVIGYSMKECGITEGDLLVVDRLKRAENGKIILAKTRRGYTIKKYKQQNGLYLVPANLDYKPIRLRRHDEFEIIGVVTGIFRRI